MYRQKMCKLLRKYVCTLSIEVSPSSHIDTVTPPALTSAAPVRFNLNELTLLPDKPTHLWAVAVRVIAMK